jgi:hypothetical protein
MQSPSLHLTNADLTWLGVEQFPLNLCAFLLPDAGTDLLLFTCHIFPELARHIA